MMSRTLMMMLAATSSGAIASAQTSDLTQSAYENRALELAGERYKVTVQRQCGIDGSAGLDGIDMKASLPATRLTDNFYYVGLSWVGAYALNTPDGIILIDTLNSAEEVKNVLVPGLEEFGLDPRSIKLVIETHEHGDHYGGAKYLHDTYGAQIIASAATWNGMATGTGRAQAGEKPTHGADIADGGIISLGGTSVQVYETPGHTPGTISLIVPVTIGGVPHKIAMWGGTGLPDDMEGLKSYVASIDHFQTHTEAAGVDMELSNHPFVDGSDIYMQQLRDNPDAPNPFVIGKQMYKRYEGVLRACAMAKLASK